MKDEMRHFLIHSISHKEKKESHLRAADIVLVT